MFPRSIVFNKKHHWQKKLWSFNLWWSTTVGGSLMVSNNFWNFHPETRGNDPFWRLRIFFKWVGEKPPTRKPSSLGTTFLLWDWSSNPLSQDIDIDFDDAFDDMSGDDWCFFFGKMPRSRRKYATFERKRDKKHPQTSRRSLWGKRVVISSIRRW